MPKRVTKVVTTTETKEEKKPKKKRVSRKKLENQIVENLVELQKVHINLAEKFDKLSSELSSLLALFELAARSFAKSSPVKQSEKDTEFLEKIDKLLDQNKTIAKGLSLMEEKIRERIYGPGQAPPQQIQQSPQQSSPRSPPKDEEYQPSLNRNRPLPRF
jgi:hypothetical protein